jgi:hypothetical protein
MSLLGRLFSFNQSGGQEVNATRNKAITENLIDGEVSVSLASGDVTISTTPYDTSQVNYGILRLTGALTASRSVLFPDGATGRRLIINATTGNYAATVKTVSGAGVIIPRTGAVWVYFDGTDACSVVPYRRSVQTAVDYTIPRDIETVFADATGGSIAITLPSAIGAAGETHIVKNVSSNTNTVTVVASEDLEASSGDQTLNQYDSITVKSDGARWWIVG